MLSYRLQLVGGVGRGSWADKTTTSPPFVCVTVKRKAVFLFFFKFLPCNLSNNGKEESKWKENVCFTFGSA